MYPHFLCIGAQKAGTTWLDQNLRYHPDIWMPPVKELHHFDCRSSSPWGLYFIYSPAIQFNLRRIAKQAMYDAFLKRQNMGWYLRFFFLQRNDQWYASLFSPSEGQIAGEITPGYARLEENSVARIHTLMPNLKIIYLLRNPIHRMWSQAAMYFSKYGYQGLHTIEEGMIKQFLDRPLHARNSFYLKTLNIWQRFYPSQQIFVGFFEQLSQEPHQLLTDIYHFFELHVSEQYIPQSLHQKVYARHYPAIPNHFAHDLAKRYIEEIEELHQRFANEYTANWLEYALWALNL